MPGVLAEGHLPCCRGWSGKVSHEQSDENFTKECKRIKGGRGVSQAKATEKKKKLKFLGKQIGFRLND